MRSKKVCRTRGGSLRKGHAGHTRRDLVPGRDADRAEEQAHLSRGQERLTPSRDPRTQSTYLFGTVCVLPICNIETMQPHLDEIATKVMPDAHANLLLDQAGWHGVSKALKIPSNISILPLPPRTRTQHARRPPEIRKLGPHRNGAPHMM